MVWLKRLRRQTQYHSTSTGFIHRIWGLPMTISEQSTPSYTRYRAAAIQYDPTLGEKEKNVAALLRLVEEAALHGACLIVLPEMATTGYCWESRAEITPHVEPIPGPTTERFAELARRYDCHIALSLPEVDLATN